MLTELETVESRVGRERRVVRIRSSSATTGTRLNGSRLLSQETDLQAILSYDLSAPLRESEKGAVRLRVPLLPPVQFRLARRERPAYSLG